MSSFSPAEVGFSEAFLSPSKTSYHIKEPLRSNVISTLANV